MCVGFGCIIDKNLNVWFTRPDYANDISHEAILHALKKRLHPSEEDVGFYGDDRWFHRSWVRGECRDWEMSSFIYDEFISLPIWVEENDLAIRNKVEKTLSKVRPLADEYRRKSDEALKEYYRAFTERELKLGRDLFTLESVEIQKKVIRGIYRKYIREISKINGYIV